MVFTQTNFIFISRIFVFVLSFLSPSLLLVLWNYILSTPERRYNIYHLVFLAASSPWLLTSFLSLYLSLSLCLAHMFMYRPISEAVSKVKYLHHGDHVLYTSFPSQFLLGIRFSSEFQQPETQEIFLVFCFLHKSESLGADVLYNILCLSYFSFFFFWTIELMCHTTTHTQCSYFFFWWGSWCPAENFGREILFNPFFLSFFWGIIIIPVGGDKKEANIFQFP